MTHDSQCEGSVALGSGRIVECCRCEVRALEARLASATEELAVSIERDKLWQAAEARLAQAEFENKRVADDLHKLCGREGGSTTHGLDYTTVLGARLARAEREAAVQQQMKWDAIRDRERAEALVAEWRPVVREAIACESAETSSQLLRCSGDVIEAVAALSPAAREAAR
jgi:hypothetical protein